MIKNDCRKDIHNYIITEKDDIVNGGKIHQQGRLAGDMAIAESVVAISQGHKFY